MQLLDSLILSQPGSNLGKKQEPPQVFQVGGIEHWELLPGISFPMIPVTHGNPQSEIFTWKIPEMNNLQVLSNFYFSILL